MLLKLGQFPLSQAAYRILLHRFFVGGGDRLRTVWLYRPFGGLPIAQLPEWYLPPIILLNYSLEKVLNVL